jgi:hypothetical protein
VAYRIGTLSTFYAAGSLSALATLNAGAVSENPGGNQATISADSKASSFIPVFGKNIATSLDRVDGKAIGAGTHQVSVDPGIHTISLTCRAVGPTNTEEFELDVLAGSHYQATALVGGQRIVPCTSIVQRRFESGALELVPVTYKVENDGLYRFKEGVADFTRHSYRASTIPGSPK